MIRLVLTTLLTISAMPLMASSTSSLDAVETTDEQFEQYEEIDFDEQEIFMDEDQQSEVFSFGDNPQLTSSSYSFAIYNKCWADIWVAVHYMDLDGIWITKGWYKIESHKKRFLLTTKNRKVYFTAHSSNNKYNWGSGPYQWSVRGSQNKFKFTEATLKERVGSYHQSLTCN